MGDQLSPMDLTPPTNVFAVTYQIDPAHSGGQPWSTLRPPLTSRWSVMLGNANLSYPLIVEDSVFLIGSSANGSKLYALSAMTGQALWGPIDIGGIAADLAWDDGRVFTNNESGIVQAFDATSGAPLWTTSTATSFVQVGAPVAVAGILYVVNDGVLFAFDEKTGTQFWKIAGGGAPTSAAYTPGTVVLEYISGTLSAYRPSDGKLLWHDIGCCSGGGGDSPVIYQGRIFARDFWQSPNGIYQVSNGQLLGGFTASTLPAFENGLGFFRASSTLEAHDLSGNVKWKFTGDGRLSSTPLAAGGFVYIGSSSGMLYAVDEQTGMSVWSDTLSAAVAPSNDTYGSSPMAGLAASLDLLVVPAGSTLTAYGN